MRVASNAGTSAWVSEARYALSGRYWQSLKLSYFSMVGAKVAVRALAARMSPSKGKDGTALKVEGIGSVQWAYEDDDPVLRVVAPWDKDLVHMVMVRSSATTRWSYEKCFFTHLGRPDRSWMLRLSAHTGIPFREAWLPILLAKGIAGEKVTILEGFGTPVVYTDANMKWWETEVLSALNEGEIS